MTRLFMLLLLVLLYSCDTQVTDCIEYVSVDSNRISFRYKGNSQVLIVGSDTPKIRPVDKVLRFVYDTVSQCNVWEVIKGSGIPIKIDTVYADTTGDKVTDPYVGMIRPNLDSLAYKNIWNIIYFGTVLVTLDVIRWPNDRVVNLLGDIGVFDTAYIENKKSLCLRIKKEYENSEFIIHSLPHNENSIYKYIPITMGRLTVIFVINTEANEFVDIEEHINNIVGLPFEYSYTKQDKK